jgi:hypothetical protein
MKNVLTHAIACAVVSTDLITSAARLRWRRSSAARRLRRFVRLTVPVSRVQHALHLVDGLAHPTAHSRRARARHRRRCCSRRRRSHHSVRGHNTSGDEWRDVASVRLTCARRSWPQSERREGRARTRTRGAGGRGRCRLLLSHVHLQWNRPFAGLSWRAIRVNHFRRRDDGRIAIDAAGLLCHARHTERSNRRGSS